MEPGADSSQQGPQDVWTPPEYAFPNSDLEAREKLLCTIRPQGSEQSLNRQLGTAGRKRRRERFSVRKEAKIWRKAIWSPDGSHILAQSSTHALDLFSFDSSASAESDTALKLQFSIQSPTPILDVAWYPFARRDEPSMWCFAMSSRDTPVKLIDASSSKVRATYGIMNHVEKFIGPQCLCFSLDGTRIYGGESSRIYVLPISTPGLNVHHLHLLPSQKGIVSSISTALDQETGSEILAVGTFSGNTGIYDLDFGGWAQGFEPDRAGILTCLKGWKEEHGSGVSQLAFHPLNRKLLFVTCRKTKEDSILLYDLDQVNEKPRFGLLAGQRSKSKAKAGEASAGEGAVIAQFLRRLNGSALGGDTLEKEASLSSNPRLSHQDEGSQQRLFFSIDWSGRWLVAGNRLGIVSAWNIEQYASTDRWQVGGEQEALLDGRNDSASEARLSPSFATDAVVLPDSSWPAQEDAITSAAIHPLSSYLLTTSGARHWEFPSLKTTLAEAEASLVSAGESDSASSSESEGDEVLSCRTFDSSLKLWSLQ